MHSSGQTPPHTVRPLRATDLSSVGGIVDDTDMFPSDLLDDMTAPFFAGSTTEFWAVADRPGDGAVGVTYCAPEQMAPDVWNMLLIAVAPPHQGMGIGTALLTHVEEVLRGHAARVLLVETSGADSFEQTREFYRGHGYVEEARIRDYYGDGEDKIVFWKSLRTPR